MLGAGAEALDVGAVFDSDHAGDQYRKEEQGELLVGDGPAIHERQGDIGDGEGDGSGDGGKADVTLPQKQDDPEGHGDQAGEGVVGEESEDDAGAGGDAFAAFEVDEATEHVAKDGGETYKEPEEVDEGVGGGEKVAYDPGGGEGGEQAFEDIEGEDEGEEFSAEESAYVGGADVSASGFAGVDALGSGDDQAKRDGAGEVGEGDEGEEDRVSMCHAWRDPRGSRRRLLYAISSAATRRS